MILLSVSDHSWRELALIGGLTKDGRGIFVIENFILELDKIFRDPILELIVFDQ